MRDTSLLNHVLSTSFIVPHSWKAERIEDAFSWCERTFGEERAGDILYEAQDGWLDLVDGYWCMGWYGHKSTWVFWFSTRDRLTQFTLTWG